MISNSNDYYSNANRKWRHLRLSWDDQKRKIHVHAIHSSVSQSQDNDNNKDNNKDKHNDNDNDNDNDYDNDNDNDNDTDNDEKFILKKNYSNKFLQTCTN